MISQQLLKYEEGDTDFFFIENCAVKERHGDVANIHKVLFRSRKVSEPEKMKFLNFLIAILWLCSGPLVME